MNIAKALKVKNRLINEVNKLQDIFKRENSRRNDDISTVDVSGIQIKVEENREKLIGIKASLNRASAPIADKLVLLAETKSSINFYKSLPTKEGPELTLIGANREKLEYEWTAHLNREAVDKMVSGLQKVINETQDEIDDFNARTQIDWVEKI